MEKVSYSENIIATCGIWTDSGFCIVIWVSCLWKWKSYAKLRILHHPLWSPSAALGRWCWGMMTTVSSAFNLKSRCGSGFILRIHNFVQVRNLGIKCPTVTRGELVWLWFMTHWSFSTVDSLEFLPWSIPGLQVEFLLLHYWEWWLKVPFAQHVDSKHLLAIHGGSK